MILLLDPTERKDRRSVGGVRYGTLQRAIAYSIHCIYFGCSNSSVKSSFLAAVRQPVRLRHGQQPQGHGRLHVPHNSHRR
jgi:hypothetical protein